MKVTVDGANVTLNCATGNLEDVLSEISQSHENNERAIWHVILNGKKYEETYPHAARKTKAEDIRTLEVSTQDQHDICWSFVENSAFILQSLITSGEKIAGFFRTGNPEEANKHFLNFLESYHYLVCLLNESSKFFKITPAGSLIPLRKDSLSSLNIMLEQMTRAQQYEDWGLLADRLEYDLLPLLKEWLKVLPLLTKNNPRLAKDSLSS